MTTRKSSLAAAARRLTDALEYETQLARTGALADLVSAATLKREAFNAFTEVRDAATDGEISEISNRHAVEELLAAANESAIVLEAVKSTLDDAANRLNSLLGSISDPGTYGRFGRPVRHVPAARIDASA